ncbi:MAG: hypothetical protein P8J20_18800 [Novosphingobium sp.]|nr:hypothetical protein [Novosphingobium sp.]
MAERKARLGDIRRERFGWIAGCAVAIAAGLVATPAHAQGGLLSARAGSKVLLDRYICAFRPGHVPVPGIRAEAQRMARPVGATVRNVYSRSLRGFSLSATDQAIRRMQLLNPILAYCEPDQVVQLVPERRDRRTAQVQVPGPMKQVTPWGIKRVGGSVRDVETCLVTLRLQRRLPDLGPTREYRLADGQLVHQAAGHVRDSRIEMTMALLGRMGREDAASLLAEVALEEGSAALRWQALRECLALDTLTGFTKLCAVVRSMDDELAPMAGALRSQLIEAHPQLAEIAECHA